MILNSVEIERHNYDEIRPRAAGTMAAWVAERATEVQAVLGRHLGWTEERQLTLRAVLGGLILTGVQDRDGEHAQLRRALMSLPMAMQRELGVVDEFGNVISYAMVEKAINAIAQVLRDKPVIVEHDHPELDESSGEPAPCPAKCPFLVADSTWFMSQLAHCSIPDDLERAPDAALDWTDNETWARVHGSSGVPDLEIDPDDEVPEAVAESIKNAVAEGSDSWPRIHENGRNLWTKDPDAQVGHRNKNNLSDLYSGFEINLWTSVCSPSGKYYAAFIQGAAISLAGTHAGPPTLAGLRNAAHNGVRFHHLIVDPGYSLKTPIRMHRPIREYVDDLVLRPTTTQHKRYEDFAVRRTVEGRRVDYRVKNLDGGFYSSATPDELDHLPYPPHSGDSKPKAQAIRALYQQREAWAFTPHGKPRGTPRYAGPATEYAGFKVRCINWPESWRQETDGRKTTKCKKGDGCSCGLVVCIPYAAVAEKVRQAQVWPTPAWDESYNRRSTVERSNGDVKGGVNDLDRATIKCFGLEKHAIYVAGRLASQNLQIAIREYARLGRPDPWDLDIVNQPEPEPQPPAPAKEKGATRKKAPAGGRPHVEAETLIREVDAELLSRKRLRLLARRKAITDRSRRERKNAKPAAPPRTKPPP